MGFRNQRGLNFSERRFVKRILLLVLAVGILWFLFAPGRGFVHYHRLQGQIEALSRDNKSLEERNAELKMEIDRLQNDDAYLEKLARKKYGMLKENETVYRFKPSTKK